MQSMQNAEQTVGFNEHDEVLALCELGAELILHCDEIRAEPSTMSAASAAMRTANRSAQRSNAKSERR
jgi:hypothetical protein